MGSRKRVHELETKLGQSSQLQRSLDLDQGYQLLPNKSMENLYRYTLVSSGLTPMLQINLNDWREVSKSLLRLKNPRINSHFSSTRMSSCSAMRLSLSHHSH